jgi:thiol reductant ABC exporter CydD subunit
MRAAGGGLPDPRLVRYTRGTRRFLGATVVLGGITAGLVVAQAWLIATTVARVVGGREQLSQVRDLLTVLLVVIAGRAAVGWFGERMADRASAGAKSDLRTALVDRIARLGPSGIDRERSGRLVVLATTGIDALDSYFARYLPQLFLAVIVPVTVVLVVLGTDWVSAVIIAVTVPLIPLFMALVGASTRTRMQRQAQLLQRLAGHFLDVVAGLPTLKVFGRAKAQGAAIRDITDRYRSATMSTLKVAFLSALILELLATFSVALVAVAVGLRLLGGHLSFQSALFVLILAPEAYLPVRQLGTNFHASAEGMRAAEDVFEVLEQPLPVAGNRRDVPDPSRSALRIEQLEVCYPGRVLPALRDVTLTVNPGDVVAIAGPSGSGKSTLLSVLLGLAPGWSGSVRVGGIELPDLDPQEWRSHLAWVPQRPHLFARSIADNVRLGCPDASEARVRAAIFDAGLDDVVARLPDGLDTVLGHDGAGLSSGERQRVALARAFVRDSPLLLLDEPTANLDGQTEEGVLAAVRRLMAGRTVVIVAHRPALLGLADRVVHLAPAVAAVAS